MRLAGPLQLDRYVDLKALRFYFQVSNSYVLNKFKRMFFPFAYSQWAPRGSGLSMDGVETRLPPRDDINAPDLYIPLMAFVTYVLVQSLVSGLNAEFTPDVLGASATAGLLALAYEVLVLKLGFYLMGTGVSIGLLDAIALSGYKFVFIIICSLVGMCFTSTGFYVAVLVCGALMATFLVRTLDCYWQPAKRSVFLVLVVVNQFAVLWLMGNYRRAPVVGAAALRAAAGGGTASREAA